MNKRYWMISVLALVLLAALLLSACGEATPTPTKTTTATPTAPATKTFKLSYTTPKGASYSKGLEWLATEFPKRTDGRYKIETYPANTLVSFGSALDAIKGRVAEIVVFPATMFVKDFPIFQCTALPIGVDLITEKDYNAVFDMMWAFINKYPEAQAEFKAFKLLWPITTPSSYWAIKNKEIHLPTDLKGMKIGAGGPPVDIVEAYGGANVNEIPPEAYMNMDKGVIDGTILSWGMSNDYKMHELVKYYFLVNLGNGTLVLAMNPEAWNEMTAADQKILTQTVDEAIRGGSVQGQLESEAAGKSAAEKSSKIYAPTASELVAWNEAAMVAANKWATNAEAAGVKNPMDFYSGFQALQKQYFPDQKK